MLRTALALIFLVTSTECRVLPSNKQENPINNGLGNTPLERHDCRGLFAKLRSCHHDVNNPEEYCCDDTIQFWENGCFWCEARRTPAALWQYCKVSSSQPYLGCTSSIAPNQDCTQLFPVAASFRR